MNIEKTSVKNAFCSIYKINTMKPNTQESRLLENFTIVDFLYKQAGKQFTVDDLVECFFDPSDSNSRTKCAATVRYLTEMNVITRTEQMTKAYFQINDAFVNKVNTVQQADAYESAEELVNRLYEKNTSDDIDFDTNIVKENTQKLLNYLKHIVRLETNIYSLKERYTQLLQDRRNAIIDGLSDVEKVDADIALEQKSLNDEISRLQNLIETEPVLNNNIVVERPNAPVEPVFNVEVPIAPVLSKPGLFNKKKIEAQNAQLQAEYDQKLAQFNLEKEIFQQKMETYNRSVDAYTAAIADCEKREADLNQADFQKRLEEYNNFKPIWQQELSLKTESLNALNNTKEQKLAEYPAQQKRKQIEYELEYLTHLIENTIQAQNKIYSYGVVYEKYRNFIALSSFCDYLVSGRCETLDGANGAYNLYEQESRADIVISKLDTIIESLEQIKQNQYYICSELEKANHSLALLNGQLLVNNLMQVVQVNQLDEIINNTAQTAYNTEVTAFYAKKNAELTDALGFMIAMH